MSPYKKQILRKCFILFLLMLALYLSSVFTILVNFGAFSIPLLAGFTGFSLISIAFGMAALASITIAFTLWMLQKSVQQYTKNTYYAYASVITLVLVGIIGTTLLTYFTPAATLITSALYLSPLGPIAGPIVIGIFAITSFALLLSGLTKTLYEIQKTRKKSPLAWSLDADSKKLLLTSAPAASRRSELTSSTTRTLAGITPIKSSSVQEEAKKHLLPHSSSKKDKKASKHLLERPESIVSPSLSSTLSQHQAPTSSARTAQPNISTSTPQEAKKGLSLHSPFSKKQPRPATVENPQASANATQSLDEAEETAKIKAATEMDACSLASDDMDTKKMEETLPNQVGVTQSQQEEKEILTNSQENEDDISKLLEGKKSPPPTPAKQQEDTALSPSTINFGFF